MWHNQSSASVQSHWCNVIDHMTDLKENKNEKKFAQKRSEPIFGLIFCPDGERLNNAMFSEGIQLGEYAIDQYFTV